MNASIARRKFAPKRGGIPAARPQREIAALPVQRPVVVIERIAQVSPAQKPSNILELKRAFKRNPSRGNARENKPKPV